MAKTMYFFKIVQHYKVPSPTLTGLRDTDQDHMYVITLYTDAAWRSQDNFAGFGWHYTDPNTGTFRHGTSHNGVCMASTLMVKAIAVREAEVRKALL